MLRAVGRTVGLVSSLGLAACSLDSTGEALGATEGDTESTGTSEDPSTLTAPTASTAPSTSSPTGSTTGDDTTGSGSGSSSDTDSGSDTGSGSDTTESSDTEGEPGVGCPDPLPSGWLFCEDFESFDASRYASTQMFELAEGEGLEGSSARLILHQAGVDWAGVLEVRVGDAPGSVVHESDQSFDELWVRLYTRTQDPWAGNGFGELLHVEARSDSPGEPRAVISDIFAPLDSSQLLYEARSCVDNDVNTCPGGAGDWAQTQILHSSLGQTELHTPDQAQQWHCVVLHTRLNTPGQADGVVEGFVDGNQEVFRDDLDLRESWTDSGLNTIRFPTFWAGGSAEATMRYQDDLVISSAPLECP